MEHVHAKHYVVFHLWCFLAWHYEVAMFLRAAGWLLTSQNNERAPNPKYEYCNIGSTKCMCLSIFIVCVFEIICIIKGVL